MGASSLHRALRLPVSKGGQEADHRVQRTVYCTVGIPTVPSLSNKYRDRVCKNLEMTGFYHTILNSPELGPDIYLTEQV